VNATNFPAPEKLDVYTLRSAIDQEKSMTPLAYGLLGLCIVIAVGGYYVYTHKE
jgi:hypothetical protein